MSRAIRLRSVYIGIVFLTAIGLAIPAANASTHHRKKDFMPASEPPAPSFTDQVAALGAKFPSAYGGQDISTSGNPVVYVVAASGARFLSAVRAEAARHPGQQYTVVDVPHSWVELEDLTIKIARDEPRWQARGINLGRWGPQAALNKVLIELRSPSTAAALALHNSYGAEWVTVSPEAFTQRVVFEDRYYDSAPFYGGDSIFPNPGKPENYCTDSFPVVNHNGVTKMLTAGHCGSRQPWYTNYYSKYALGNTTDNYFSGFGGSTFLDIQHVDANAASVVWGNSTQQYYPYTTYTPVKGDGVCFDGARTGLVCDTTVINPGPFCIKASGYEDCWLGQVSSNFVACQPGDSGGPVFQRTSNGNYVKAVGSISAAGTGGTSCYYTQMSAIESITHVSLLQAG